jgi:hypothetical protein
MGKERTMTRALQRGAVDNFVVKKRWVKGRAGGPLVRNATRREEKGGRAAGRGAPTVEVGSGRDRGGGQVVPRHSPGGTVQMGLNPIQISNEFKLF